VSDGAASMSLSDEPSSSPTVREGPAGWFAPQPGALSDALRRLDQRLLAACNAEERRARRLAGSGSTGWEGVRDLIRPGLEELAGEDLEEAGPLVPAAEPFAPLARSLGLTAIEQDIVLVALAPHVEARYQAVYAVLQDDLEQPLATERLLRAVLGRGAGGAQAVAAAVGGGAPLRRADILTSPATPFPPLARPFDLAPDVAAVLLGLAHPPVVGAPSHRWDVGRGETTATAPFLVVFGIGDRSALARGAADLGTDLLEVELPPDPAAAHRAATSAWRLGAARGAIPVLDVAALPEADRAALATHLDSLVRDVGGRAWVLSPEALALTVPQVPVAPSTWAERRTAWVAAVGARGGSLDLLAAGRLASRHRLSGTDLDRALDAAVSLDEDDLHSAAAGMAFRHVDRSNLTMPTRSFEDVVLRDTTEQALRRLLYFVRHRDRVAVERGLGRRHRIERGPLVLFSGRSGTGKTLAAEALAGALDRPLHTVDLAQLVSKYIGETEKHIDDVLRQAERANAVLFFDEADAIFANRVEKSSSATEQFANMLVGYLLQRIEVHDGLVILATNLRQAIDEAFLRRFQFRIEFPLPEPDERARIWDLLLPAGGGRADDLDLDAIGRTHRLSGGDIRNAALKAVFLAEERGRPVGHADLEEAVALEMLELGRLSRRPEHAAGDDGAGPDRGALLRACVDAFHDELEAYLRTRFLKEIHVVHGSPTKDRLAGRRPAISLALFRMAAERSGSALRIGFIVSAWSSRAEEESELLGVVHEALSTIELPPADGRAITVRLQESHDFDLLHRFWTSHDHPVRPSLVLDVDIPAAAGPLK
jgi:AAA+ superfamily predicted ATPase